MSLVEGVAVTTCSSLTRGDEAALKTSTYGITVSVGLSEMQRQDSWDWMRGAVEFGSVDLELFPARRPPSRQVQF